MNRLRHSFNADRNVLIIGSSIRVGHRIGKGNFGDIRLGIDLFNDEYVAIKLENRQLRSNLLKNEARWYKELEGTEGFPKMFSFGSWHHFNVLVMELLGPSLQTLFDMFDRSFSIKTICMIAIQLLKRFEVLHSRGIVYCDVKPENFLIGRSRLKLERTIHVVDFGLAKTYIKPGTNEHVPFRTDCKLSGTIRYISINRHDGCEHSRRDDVEALGYVLVYFLRGSMPWQGIELPNLQQRYNMVGELKRSTAIESLCNELPEEFAVFLRYARSMDYTQAPDYKYLTGLFTQFMFRNGMKCDWKFDWDEAPLTESPDGSLYALDLQRNIKLHQQSMKPAGDLSEEVGRCSLGAQSVQSKSVKPGGKDALADSEKIAGRNEDSALNYDGQAGNIFQRLCVRLCGGNHQE